jgi:hypothetical protein
MTRMSIRKVSQSPKAIETIKSALRKSQTFLKTDAILVLTCGKQPNQDSPGGRDRIIDYAKSHLKQFQFFIAESVFNLSGHKDIDLLSLEKLLLGFCDCVLIVLESQSTFSELGAFAIEDDLVKNMLVINDINFKDSTSFISLGPLAKVNKESRFGPVIHVDLKSILRAAPEISKRLSITEKKKKKRFHLGDFRKFQEAPAKVRMLFLLDMITFFQPLTHKEIISILTAYYGDQSFKVNLDLHLLNALGLTTTIEGYYMRPTDNQRLFFAYYGLNEISVRSDVVNHYHKYSRERVSVLKDKAGELL